MSTHVQPAQTSRTDQQTDATTRPADAQPRDGESAATIAELSPATPEPDSWTDRCQQQFDPTRTARLRNLVDEANLVVISPGSD